MAKLCARSAALCALAAHLALTTACVHPRLEAGPDGAVVSTTAKTGWHRKKVMTKRAPEALLADDATLCRVSAERFKATKIGDMIYCNWQ